MNEVVSMQAWAFWFFIALVLGATGWMTWRMERMRKRMADLSDLNNALLTVLFKQGAGERIARIEIDTPKR